ncbi:ribonuclease-like [Pelodiscus sinensis]|uniref:ribonuclease-like n=1 Tax=Pelodiscus sinensis TaxID=13735 RepID=UPI003F6AD823
MALTGTWSTLLLPLILLGAGLALANKHPWDEQNDRFLLRHWNYPRSEAPDGTYCQAMMQHRDLSGQDSNTFIHAPAGSINSICSLGGRPGLPNQRRSVAPFHLTLCALNATSHAYAETRYHRRVVLACWRGLPVDYVKHI